MEQIKVNGVTYKVLGRDKRETVCVRYPNRAKELRSKNVDDVLVLERRDRQAYMAYQIGETVKIVSEF